MQQSSEMIAERDLANSETIQVHQKSARVRACLKESRTALEAAVNGKEWSEYWIEFSPQTSRGSFSAVSTPIFASK